MPYVIDRRTFLVSASVGTLAACSFPPINNPSTNQATFGDAHVHLFNAADLPVRGFFENVIAHYKMLENFQFLVPALVDIAQYVMKPLAKTATEEWEGLDSLGRRPRTEIPLR